MAEPADPPVIRPVREEDAEAIVAMTAEVFGPFCIDKWIEDMLGPAGTAGWVQIKGQAVLHELRENPQGCFVAEVDGRVSGYVTTVVNALASRGVIANLAVMQRAQGRGIGRKLLERALEHFRRLGLAQAKIETLACNQVGRHLYPSLGFREVVRQVHFVMPLR